MDGRSGKAMARQRPGPGRPTRRRASCSSTTSAGPSLAACRPPSTPTSLLLATSPSGFWMRIFPTPSMGTSWTLLDCPAPSLAPTNPAMPSCVPPWGHVSPSGLSGPVRWGYRVVSSLRTIRANGPIGNIGLIRQLSLDDTTRIGRTRGQRLRVSNSECRADHAATTILSSCSRMGIRWCYCLRRYGLRDLAPFRTPRPAT